MASLDEKDEEGQSLLDPAMPEAAPDLAYDRAWAHEVLARSLARLEAECARNGHAELCAALEPVLFQDPNAPAYAEIAKQLGMTDAAVKTAAYRIRQRMRTFIREEVLQTVTNQEGLVEELKYLQGLFARSAV